MDVNEEFKDFDEEDLTLIGELENHIETEDFVCTPPDLKEEVEKSLAELLPEKSKGLYNATYDSFRKWMTSKRAKSISENTVLGYFPELAKTFKASTLWAKYSMLKATVKLNDNIDISCFNKVTALLKRKSVGFRSTKSRLLTNTEVEKFIKEAPNRIYLATKVCT